MREQFLASFLALHGAKFARADFQFIEFWEAADEYASELFSALGAASKKHASAFDNRYERAKRAVEFYQDSGPCDSGFTNPSYAPVEMRSFDTRASLATNLNQFADMLDDWIDSYACLASHNRVEGKKIRVPERSVKDIRKLAKNKAYQDEEFAYHISPTTMDYDEALAYCYLRGSWLAQPDGDKNRFGAMSAALPEYQYYWYQGDESCTAIYTGYRYSYRRNCQEKYPAVCETGQYTDKCYPAPGSAGFGRCTAWGDPHYTTFDGEYHHFQGSCEYTMVEVDSVQYPNMPWFKIVADLDYFSTGVYTHTRGFTFEFPGQGQSPDEIPRYVLSADGWRWQMRSAVLEDRQLGVSYTRSFNGNPDFDFSVGWDRVDIRTYFGLSAYYDARNDARLQISIPDCYKNNVKGLCGNFNGQKYDEFSQTSLTHQMQNWKDIQQDLLDWATSFEVPDERCRQIHDFECDVHVSDAINSCQPIDPENSEGLFSEHCSVDQAPFNTACVLEVCDGTDRCSALQSYAKACLNDLAPEDRAPVCDWAAEFGCEPECGANSEFNGCADSCAATRTCENRHLDDFERCRGENEIEGFCVCEDGYILEDGVCILESDCGCNFDGSYYKLGEEFSTTEDNCECTSDGVVVCVPIPCEDKEKGTCRVHSDPYIETFDGVAYDFHGTCRYSLASYEDTPARAGFNIDFSNRREVQWNLTEREWGDGSVLDQVWLEFHARDYTFGDAKRFLLHINNLDTSDDYHNTNLDVRLFDRATRKVYYNEDVNIGEVSIDIDGQDVTINLWNGVKITYEQVYWDMTLEVPNCFKDAIFGLCGNWDDSQASETQIASDYKTDPDALGESFKTQTLPFCSHGKYLAPCEALPADELNAVEEKCAALDDSNSEADVFQSCGFLDKHYYHDGCLFNGCIKRDWACGFIQSYAQRCLVRKNPLSSDFKTVCSWPKATGCERECPAGQVFKGCTNRCLEQRTCDDVVDGISNEARCSSQRAIYAMCGCPDGQVMHEGECINEDACPRDCETTEEATCIVWGDPHYQTFDGEFHHFQGACRYTLAESKGDDEFRNVPAFKLEVDQERCGEFRGRTPVSCVRRWNFEFPAEGQTSDETPRYIVSVDSSRAVLEDRWTGASYTNNKNSDDFTFSTWPSITVTTWFGARITNARYHRLDLTLPSCYMSHVDGLCGNYDGVTYDKFSQIESTFLSSNWEAYQTGLIEWANDFAEPDPRCREVIDFECDDIDEVTDMCLPLDKNIPSGVFHDCTADKTAAYVSCLIDGCADRTSLCDSLANYAKTCLNTIPAHLRSNVCSWASETGCEKECGANSQFEGCASTCAATRTCVNRHMSDAERCGSTIDEFDSMCVCEPGFILDGDSCILEEDCGCVWDHNGVYYSQGSTFSTDEENCECTSDGVVCTPIPCENRGTAYCRAHNDPYIRTFDGYQYGFHGDCRYNLASAPDRDDVPGFNVDIKNRKPWLPFIGAVTDQIWFDFHGRDYVAGDAKKYSLYIRNVDDSDDYRRARFEVTLEDNETGEKIIDAVSEISRHEAIITDDYRIYLYYSSSDGPNIYSVYVRTWNGLKAQFYYGSWSFYLWVNGCYKNEMAGLCGNYDGDYSVERLLRADYEADGASFGDRFQTDDDETCSHGGRLTPCEDLTTVEYNSAYSRCEAVRQPTLRHPLSSFYRNIFSGCEFLGDRTEVHEACLFNSCVKDGLQCGIIGEYAAACLEKKTPGTADFDRICNWAAATNCEEECPADQVYKGCTNSCFEAQTCEDVARAVSKEDRCGTDNVIEGMCGCPEGQVFEDGACVDETSCGCITADGLYVRIGEEVEGSGELCTCTEEGMECVDTGPCTVFVGNTPEMITQKENMADVDISKPFKVSLQFDSSNYDFRTGYIMQITDTEKPRFSSSMVDPDSAQIEDPRFSTNDRPLAALYRGQSYTWFAIGLDDSTDFTDGDFDKNRPSYIQTHWAGLTFGVATSWVAGWPEEGWKTFEFEHSFDEDTGLWTNTWTADGELILSTTNSDDQWHAGYDFHIGLGSEAGWTGAEIEIKNFKLCQTLECPADQVYKGSTNNCFEAQTCEDVARGVSKEDRCGTDNVIEGICGCPEGQVFEDGACVDETSCGCITADGLYVRIGEEFEGSGELCTCTEEGMECVDTAPCTVFIGDTPEMSINKENMADVDITKPFKVSLQFDCSNYDFRTGYLMHITDTEKPRFSSSVVDPTSPQIEDPRFSSNDRPLAAIFRSQTFTWFAIGLDDSTDFTTGDFDPYIPPRISHWAGGTFDIAVNFVAGCPGEGWTTFEFEHSFDEDTGLWTNTWSANGELIVSTTNSDDQWHAGYDFHIGLGSEEGASGAEIEIKNFKLCSQTLECPAYQVYKVSTNSCFEAQTCEDVARGVSKEDRCGADNVIEGMCGCPEGQVLEDGACVDETSCGCITADGLYVRIGEEVEGSGELCTCTEEGMECVDTGPCIVFIGDTPEMSMNKENMADIDISKPFKVSLQFDCSNNDFGRGYLMQITNTEKPRFSSSVMDPDSPQIEDPRFSTNDRPLAAIGREQRYIWFAIGVDDSTDFTDGDFDKYRSSLIQTHWAGGTFGVAMSWVAGCPGEGWTTFEFEHSFDEDTGQWTNTWTANGELILSTTNSDDQWHAGYDFHIGLGSEEHWTGAEIELKNFKLCRECIQTFIGPVPEISGARDHLAHVDVSKPFKTSFEMDCNNDDFKKGVLFHITDRETVRLGGASVGPAELEKKKRNKKKRNLEDEESKLSAGEIPLAMIVINRSYIYFSIGLGTSTSFTNYDFETYSGPLVENVGFDRYSTWLTDCPADGWATYEFEHSFDEDTNLWTNTWRIDGVPVISTTNSDAEWNAGNDFWIGLGDGGTHSWGSTDIKVKNFVLDCSEQ